MPATKEPVTEVASGSFADAAGGDEGEELQETHVEPAIDDAGAAEKAAADAAAAAASTTTTTKKDGNPNLDDDEPAATTTTTTAADDEIPADYTKGMTTAAATKAKETWKTLKQERAAAAAERDAARAELAAAQKRIEEAGKTGPEVERLKKEIADRDARLAEYEGEISLTRIEEAGKTGPEVERLKKEIADRDARLAEYEGEISLTRIEATSQYKSSVAEPIKNAEEFVRGLAKQYELTSSAALLDALRETDPQKRKTDLEELSSDFSFADRTELFAAAKAHANATAAGESMRKEAGTKLEQLTREEQQQLERAATANLTEFRTSAEERFKSVQEELPILRHVEGKPEWNAYVDSIKADIAGIDVNNLPIVDVAKAVVADRVLPEVTKAMLHYQGAFKKEKEARIAAEKKLADYRSTAPGAGGGRTTDGGPSGGRNGDESFLGAVAGDGD